CFKFGDGLRRDHTAIGDHTDTDDVETSPQALDHRNQCCYVGCVARPHLRAHRMTITVDQHRHNHLSQIRSMILAISVASERLPAGALEVQTGRVHEYQVEASEQVAPMREQTLLDYILEAARRERRSTVLLLCRQLLTKPRHRPIEMVQIERFDV